MDICKSCYANCLVIYSKVFVMTIADLCQLGSEFSGENYKDKHFTEKNESNLHSSLHVRSAPEILSGKTCLAGVPATRASGNSPKSDTQQPNTYKCRPRFIPLWPDTNWPLITLIYRFTRRARTTGKSAPRCYVLGTCIFCWWVFTGCLQTLLRVNEPTRIVWCRRTKGERVVRQCTIRRQFRPFVRPWR